MFCKKVCKLHMKSREASSQLECTCIRIAEPTLSNVSTKDRNEKNMNEAEDDWLDSETCKAGTSHSTANG